MRTFIERKTLFKFILNRFQYCQIPSSASITSFHLSEFTLYEYNLDVTVKFLQLVHSTHIDNIDKRKNTYTKRSYYQQAKL